jgi:uncharacterized membrane protein YfbV (UPF0208 family)
MSRASHQDAHPLSRPSGREALASEQAAYDRAIRQLRVCIRLLSAALLGLLARIVVDGATLAVALAAAVVALLLLAAGALWRYGRRVQPHASASRTVTRRARRD